MEDKIVITAIDPVTKKVDAYFSHARHELNHSFFVDNVDDRNAIIVETQNQFAKYRGDVDVSVVNVPQLPADVASLIQPSPTATPTMTPIADGSIPDNTGKF